MLAAAWVGIVLLLLFRLSAASPPSRHIYMVTSTIDAATESILNCGNVAMPDREQAEAYSRARPGTHVVEVTLRQITP